MRYEFDSAFMIGITIPIGYKKHFNYFGLNPLTLTKNQARKYPTLLLHGACHNQGVWLYLAKALESTNSGPFFTVNISIISKSAIKKSFDLVYQEIENIQQLYLKWHRKPVAVNLIGYSAGSLFAYFVNLDKKCWSLNNDSGCPTMISSMVGAPNIHTVISIGDRIEISLSNVYEIVGAEDILVPPLRDVYPQDGKQKVVECGHLKMIRHPATHKHLYKILSDDGNIESDCLEQKTDNDTVQHKKGCLNRFFKRGETQSTHELNRSHYLPQSKPSCVIL